MNVKILQKIRKTVRFEITKDENGQEVQWDVLQKNREGEWINVMSSVRKAKAYNRKHNAWLQAIRSLGKTGFLLERRRKRALSSKQKIELIERFEKITKL